MFRQDVLSIQDVPEDVKNLLQGQDAEMTIFLPPRESANGVLYSHAKDDLSARAVRNIALVHMIDKKLTLEDFFALSEGEAIDTILAKEVITPSLVGATSGSSTGDDPESTRLIEGDLDACVENSVMHSITNMLVPTEFSEGRLPPSAAPRAIGKEDDRLLSPAVLYSIIGAGGVLVLSLVAILVYCLCCFRSKKKEPDNDINMSQKFPNSTTSTAAGTMPYWMVPQPPSMMYMPPQKPGHAYHYNDGAMSAYGTGSSMSHSQGYAPQGNLGQQKLGVASTGDTTYQQHKHGAYGSGANGSTYGVQPGFFSAGNGTQPMSSHPGTNGTMRSAYT